MYFSLVLLLFLQYFSRLSQSLLTNAAYFQPQNRTPFVLAHRGASGYLPESTLPAFIVAIYGNTDFIELDVVLTKDRDLLVLHDPFLSRVTNIAEFPAFADRRTTRLVDNQTITDFFVDDFTLEETRLLRVRQALAPERPKVFDFLYSAPSLDEVLQLVIQENAGRIAKGRPPVGVYLEAKNGKMYKEIYGVEIGEFVLEKLRKYGVDTVENATKYCPIVLQAFSLETTAFFNASGNLLPRIQLMNQGIYNYSLETVENVAHGVGVPLSMVFEETAENPVEISNTYKNSRRNGIVKTDFVEKAHGKGLKVMAYTFRDDVSFFGENPRDMYLLAKDFLELDAVFTEFFDVALTVYQTQRQIVGEIGRSQRNSR